MENNTPRAATQSQWEDLPKKIQAQQYKPVATITYSYNDFQNVWSNLNTSNYSSGYTRETAFMENFPWELSVDFNDLKNYLNIELEDGAPSTQQYSSVPITFQLQSYLGTGDAREYIDKQFGDGAITFSNYPAIDDIQITVQPFGQSVSWGGSRRSVGEDAYVFIRENNVSNLFSFSRNETSYQLTTFPINFTATPDFTNGVVAFSNTYNIAPFDLSVGSYNATWRDLCEQVVQGVFPTIRLAGNWYTKSNTDTVQILEGRVFNRSGAGREGTAIDLTTLISFSPEGVNNMPNTYNMDCLATLRLHQNYALETIATKMVGSGSGGGETMIVTLTQTTIGQYSDVWVWSSNYTFAQLTANPDAIRVFVNDWCYASEGNIKPTDTKVRTSGQSTEIYLVRDLAGVEMSFELHQPQEIEGQTVNPAIFNVTNFVDKDKTALLILPTLTLADNATYIPDGTTITLQTLSSDKEMYSVSGSSDCYPHERIINGNFMILPVKRKVGSGASSWVEEECLVMSASRRGTSNVSDSYIYKTFMFNGEYYKMTLTSDSYPNVVYTITKIPGGQTYTAGDGISITNGVISCTFANGNGVSY